MHAPAVLGVYEIVLAAINLNDGGPEVVLDTPMDAVECKQSQSLSVPLQEHCFLPNALALALTPSCSLDLDLAGLSGAHCNQGETREEGSDVRADRSRWRRAQVEIKALKVR
jgi:hypothetical protein